MRVCVCNNATSGLGVPDYDVNKPEEEAVTGCHTQPGQRRSMSYSKCSLGTTVRYCYPGLQRRGRVSNVMADQGACQGCAQGNATKRSVKDKCAPSALSRAVVSFAYSSTGKAPMRGFISDVCIFSPQDQAAYRATTLADCEVFSRNAYGNHRVCFNPTILLHQQAHHHGKPHRLLHST